jgi:anti-sigma B factor antagonist
VPVSIGPGPDEPLLVDVRKDASPTRRLIHVRGELDFATAPALERRLGTLVGSGVHHLVVDLADLSFCDLAGVRVLLRLDRQLRDRGGFLTLLGPCHWVTRIVTMLDLTDQLQIQPPAGSDGASQDGASQDGAGQDGAGQDGAGQDGAASQR